MIFQGVFFLKDKGDYYSLLFSWIFNTEVWGSGRRVETGGETVEWEGFCEEDGEAKPSDARAWYSLPSHMLSQGKENVVSVNGMFVAGAGHWAMMKWICWKKDESDRKV